MLYAQLLELLEEERPFAFAMVVDSSGSTPQKAGANALFEAAGPVHGTLGGGCLEAESRRRALQAMDTGEAFAFDLKLDEVKGWDDGLICGGKVRVFVNPDVSRNADAYRQMLASCKSERRGVLVTFIQHPELASGTAIWLDENEIENSAFVAQVAPIRQILSEGKPALAPMGEGEIEVFVEPVIPAPKLVIAGAGHIGKATAHHAARLGFHVTVIDDRPVFANETHVPDAHHVVCGDIAKEMGALELGSDSYVLIVTRGHRHDGAVLAACVNKPCQYIGMIGSKRKSLLIRESLVEEGIATKEAVDRVVSPVGLDIGAESVEEIALSIAAQLVAVRRKQQLTAEALTYSR